MSSSIYNIIKPLTTSKLLNPTEGSFYSTKDPGLLLWKNKTLQLILHFYNRFFGFEIGSKSSIIKVLVLFIPVLGTFAGDEAEK